MYPRLVIDMEKLRGNIDGVAKIAKDQGGCSLMIVTKALCADEKVVEMIASHPAVDYLADSRVQNIKKNYETIKANGKQSVLLRLPMASEIEEVVKYVDISFNSEMATLEMLDAEAAKQGKVHKAVLMIDVGDLREGIFFQNEEEIIETAKKINDMANVELYGVGVNLTCYGAIIPKNDNLSIICDFAAKIEEA
ncbi:MAG: alanine racemase, partial [Firmicutes bacterium]|nr:alanine racemase [Bacillota bacterium]